MQARHVVGLALLIAAVPLQMYLMKYNQEFKNMVSEIVKTLPGNLQGLTVDFIGYVHATSTYLRSIYDFFGLSTPLGDNNVPKEEIEVPDHLIRNFRPPHLEFRVGDIVLTRNLIVGAIVGWAIDMTDLSKEPVYYVIAENYEDLVEETQNHMIEFQSDEIKHESINKYFKSFDGQRYTPNEWLQKMYPKD